MPPGLKELFPALWHPRTQVSACFRGSSQGQMRGRSDAVEAWATTSGGCPAAGLTSRPDSGQVWQIPPLTALTCKFVFVLASPQAAIQTQAEARSGARGDRNPAHGTSMSCGLSSVKWR